MSRGKLSEARSVAISTIVAASRALLIGMLNGRRLLRDDLIIRVANYIAHRIFVA